MKRLTYRIYIYILSDECILKADFTKISELGNFYSDYLAMFVQ